MQENAESQKTKKKPSEFKSEGVKPKAIQYKRTLEVKKQKQIHQNLNPWAVNQRQKMQKDAGGQKRKKNSSELKPEGLRDRSFFMG